MSISKTPKEGKGRTYRETLQKKKSEQMLPFQKARPTRNRRLGNTHGEKKKGSTNTDRNAGRGDIGMVQGKTCPIPSGWGRKKNNPSSPPPAHVPGKKRKVRQWVPKKNREGKKNYGGEIGKTNPQQCGQNKNHR